MPSPAYVKYTEIPSAEWMTATGTEYDAVPAASRQAMNAYAPRRQSKRWLDGDVPREVLAIYKDPREPSEPYTIFYAALQRPEDGYQSGLVYIGLDESGSYSHGEMPVRQVADYRFLNAHRACKWTSLPAAVRRAVVNDIEEEESTWR